MTSFFKQRVHDSHCAHVPTSTKLPKPRLLAFIGISTLALLGPVAAQAQVVGFNGYYAFSNWTKVTPSASTITYNATTDKVTLRGPTTPSYANFTIQAAGPGTWSFVWNYTTTDSTSLPYDQGGYYLYYGATKTPITLATDSSGTWAGSKTFTITPDINGNLPTIGFYTSAAFPNSFPGFLSISSFVAPSVATSPVSEPSALFLLAAGGFGAAIARRKLKA